MNLRPRRVLALGQPLQRLRTLLSRERLKAAREEIRSRERLGSANKSELLLEQARLAAFEGRWSACLGFSHEALADPGTVSRLTLLQIHSVAYFELGDFRGAERDLDRIESMRAMYPHSPIHLYAAALRIRVNARLGRRETATAQLHILWKRSLTDLSLDTLLTLLRAEVDLRLFLGIDARACAAAARFVAEAHGNRLYAALARVDLLRAGFSGPDLAAELQADSLEFVRVKSLLRSIRPVANPDAFTLGSPAALHVSGLGLLVTLSPVTHRRLKLGESAPTGALTI